VGGYPTTVDLQSSRNPSASGQVVTFTGIVQQVRPNDGIPTGSLRFTITNPGAQPIVQTVALSRLGGATFNTTAMALGQNTVTAEYIPTGLFAASSAQLAQTVTLRPTTTTVVVSTLTPTNFGQAVTFTATARTLAGVPGPPTGSMEFIARGPLGDLGAVMVPLNNQGVAVWTTSNLMTGAVTVTATYRPTALYAASSGAGGLTVVGKPTTTTLTSSLNPSGFGQSVSLTAQVRTVNAGNGTPTGSVQFDITGPTGVVSTSTVQLNNGSAVFRSTTVALGTNTVTARYVPSGALGFEPSSATLRQVVVRGSSSTTVASNTNRPRAGQSVTLTATVTPAGATGTVQFTVNGVPFGGPVTVLANGRATLTTSTLRVGTLSIRAIYSGGPNALGSTSAIFTMTVR
jgi:hypothetical protein